MRESTGDRWIPLKRTQVCLVARLNRLLHKQSICPTVLHPSTRAPILPVTFFPGLDVTHCLQYVRLTRILPFLILYKDNLFSGVLCSNRECNIKLPNWYTRWCRETRFQFIRVVYSCPLLRFGTGLFNLIIQGYSSSTENILRLSLLPACRIWVNKWHEFNRNYENTQTKQSKTKQRVRIYIVLNIST